MVTDELRTPLNALRASMELLQDLPGHKPALEQRSLQRMGQSLNRLDQLVPRDSPDERVFQALRGGFF